MPEPNPAYDPQADLKPRARRGGARKTENEWKHPFKSAAGASPCRRTACGNYAVGWCEQPGCEDYHKYLCNTHQAEHDSLVAIRAVGAELPSDLEKNIESFSGLSASSRLAKIREEGSNMYDAARMLLEDLWALGNGNTRV
jgi:hypothetical protein